MAARVPSRVVGLVRISRDCSMPVDRMLNQGGGYVGQRQSRFTMGNRTDVVATTTSFARCGDLHRELIELFDSFRNIADS